MDKTQAQLWLEKRANQISGEMILEAEGKPVTLDWNKIYFIALLDYLEACGVKPLPNIEDL